MYLLFWFIMKYSRPEKGYVLGFSAAGALIRKQHWYHWTAGRPNAVQETVMILRPHASSKES